MVNLSSIGGVQADGLTARPSQAGTVQGALVTAPQDDNHNNGIRAMIVSSSQATALIQSTSILGSTEPCSGNRGLVLSTSELIALVLLELILQHLQGGDEEQEKWLAKLMSLVSQQQSSDAGGGLFMYSSSSLSIQNTQITTISVDNALEGYGGTASGAQEAPTADAQLTGLDIIV